MAKLVGVTRQTIYYLEKGSYNPSLTLSLKIAEIFNKSVNEIFYFEPIVKDLLGNKTLDELEDFSEKSGIDTKRLIKLKNLDDAQLSKFFNKEELFTIANFLDTDFDSLFIIE